MTIGIWITLTALIYAAPSSDPTVTPNESLPGVIIEGTQSYESPGGSSQHSISASPPPQSCAWEGAVRICDGDVTALRALAEDDVSMPAEVRRAVEEVGLPALTVNIQPGERTLVNAPTIFYAEAPVFTHATVLLGQAVEITATPSSFTWHHGDGTSQTTRKPGGPYPSTDVTHTYTAVAASLTPRVDVSYTVTFRVNGGPAQSLEQTITAPGPAATLEVAEARPVIVAP